MKIKLTLLLLLSCTIGFAQKQTIALNLQKDSTYYMNSNTSVTITQDIAGAKQVISTIISGRVSNKVISIKDSLYEMEVQFKSLGLHLDLPNGRVLDFNSTNKEKQNVFAKLLNSLLDKPFSLTIAQSGRVVSVKGIDKIFYGMMTAFPEVSEQQKLQFMKQMEQSFGEKAIKERFQSSFAIFPSTKVNLGDKWVVNTVMKSAIPFNISATYTFKNMDSDAYFIHGDAIITDSKKDVDYHEIKGLPMRYTNVQGNVTVDLKLDKKTCWIREAKITRLVKGMVLIKDNPKVPGGTSFPMMIIADMTVDNK